MKYSSLLFVVSLLLGACSGNTSPGSVPVQDVQDSTPTAGRPGDTAALSPLSLLIDISEQQLSVMRGADTVRRLSIAVGSSEYPTPTGEFKVHRIDWNPDWTPPDSEWTEGKEATPPGHPDNPMGRVRIVYQMPYTIHGTENLKSLGKRVSHGSVRVANAEVIELARLIMESSGASQPADWYNRVLRDSTTMVQVDLPQRVPLTNRQ